MDYISIGSAPANEDCVSVDPNTDYIPAMKAECRRFADLIAEKLGVPPAGARLSVKGFSHDFGTYYEVVCFFDEDDEEAVAYALKCESDAPANWSDESAEKQYKAERVSEDRW